MTRTRHNNPLILRSALAALLVITAPVSRGQDVLPAATVDTSEWRCEFCPFAKSAEGSYSASVAHISDDAAKFGASNGYDKKGLYPDLGGSGILAGDGYYLNWTAENLGLDSRALGARAVFAGGTGLTADYREVPHNVFDTTATIFRASGPDQLGLPSNWQNSALTSGFSTLDASLRKLDIGSQRKSLRLEGRKRLSPSLRMSVRLSHRRRYGNDILGGAYYTQAALLPRTLDHETNELHLGLSWSGTRGHLRVGWLGSWFENDNAFLTWRNPFTSPAGAEQARLAQEPDNRASQLSLRGQYRFDPFNTVLNFTGAIGRLEQDELLADYTINPGLASNPLPRTRFDGRVDTTALSLSLSARPHERARVRAALHFNERDNRSSQDSWQRVIVDSFLSSDAEPNIPYDYQRSRIKVDGDYKWSEKLRLAAGAQRERRERDFQEVAEQTEDRNWGEVRWRPGAESEVRIVAGRARRDIDRYQESVALTFGQNPLLRKYNLAYRYREFAELQASAPLPDTPLSISVGARYANDSYTRSQAGLTSGRDLMVNADVDWAVSARSNLLLSAGWHDISSHQTGAETTAGTDWRAANDDEFLEVGARLRIRNITAATDFEFDVLRTDGRSDVAMSTTAGLSLFPAFQSTRESIAMWIRHRKSERLQAIFQLRYESFESNDWALRDIGSATIPTVLTLGADPYNYDVFVLAAGFSYAFGQPDAQSP